MLARHTSRWNQAARKATVEWKGVSNLNHGEQGKSEANNAYRSGIPVIGFESFPRLVAANFFSGTYSAFCRNYGDHTTKAVGYHCWNDEAMESMSSTMKTPWDNLCQSLLSSQDNNSNLIKNAFKIAIALSMSHYCLIFTLNANCFSYR
jgi:hypothetical protein